MGTTEQGRLEVEGGYYWSSSRTGLKTIFNAFINEVGPKIRRAWPNVMMEKVVRHHQC